MTSLFASASVSTSGIANIAGTLKSGAKTVSNISSAVKSLVPASKPAPAPAPVIGTPHGPQDPTAFNPPTFTGPTVGTPHGPTDPTAFNAPVYKGPTALLEKNSAFAPEEPLFAEPQPVAIPTYVEPAKSSFPEWAKYLLAVLGLGGAAYYVVGGKKKK